MRSADQQNDVLKRTDRRELPIGCVSRNLTDDRLLIHGLIAGEWSEGLDEGLLAEAWVFADLKSSFYSARGERRNALTALGDKWGDLVVEVPRALTDGDHRVRLAITVALSKTHASGGRILARSADFVIVDGPEGRGGKASILPTRPSDLLPGLCRLVIEEPDGPVLEISRRLPGISWKELARHPKFKFGVLEGCVRQVLLHIAFRQECADSWGKAWLELPGVKGRDLPELENLDHQDAHRAASGWAFEATEACLTALDIDDLFSRASATEEADR